MHTLIKHNLSSYVFVSKHRIQSCLLTTADQACALWVKKEHWLGTKIKVYCYAF